MSRTTAPLLSFGASGQIAKTQVYSKWKGRPYVRRYVIPANPQTAEQTKTRSAFAFLQHVWQFAPANLIAAYDAYASGQVMTGRNAFGKANIGTLREASDLDLLLFSPGAKGGFAATSIAAASGSTQLTVTLGAPAIPSGWSIDKAVAVAIKDQDPNTGVDYAMFVATDASAPYAPVITGLTNGVLYQVGGWFEFTRPDGFTAYGRSINDQETPA